MNERTHWHDRWDAGRIGFHRSEVNEHLQTFLGELTPGPILVPLCGKSVDLWYLREQGFAPVGVEFVEEAAHQFFAEASVKPSVDSRPPGTLWSGAGVTVAVGDFFSFPFVFAETSSPKASSGDADASSYASIWDRAALIALEPDDRKRYRDHIYSLLAPGGTYLLVTLDYAPDALEGPPFSLSDACVEELFGAAGALTRLYRGACDLPPAAGGQRGHESVFKFVAR